MQLLVFMDFGDNELFPLMLEETMHQSFLLPPFQVPRGEKRRGQSRGAPLLRKPMPDTVCEQDLVVRAGSREGVERHTAPRHELNHFSNICQAA